MSVPSLSGPVARTAPSVQHDVRLHGRWLLLARIGIVAIALLALWLVVEGILLYTNDQSGFSPAGLPDGWSANELRAALVGLHLSTGFYSAYRIAFLVTFSLTYFLVAAILFWRRSDEWMALFVAFFLIVFGAIWPVNTDGLKALYPPWAWPITFAEQLSQTCLVIFFFLFPNGRFAPRWTRWLAAGMVVSIPFVTLIPALPTELNLLIFVGGLVAVLLAQVYRYRRISTPIQRQQTKWVVAGFTTSLLATIGLLVIGAIFPSLDNHDASGLLYELVGTAVGNLLFLPIPLSIAIAILRYRLWDIDTIINKALVYGLLTALLAALYVALILGLTSLVSLVAGKSSDEPIALVISTLVIAALFQPVRRRIQALIDRRFYRQKYDAAKTLAAFNAALRHEVNLEQVREQLLAVVNETMQPSHISLWLRQPERLGHPSLSEGQIKTGEGAR